MGLLLLGVDHRRVVVTKCGHHRWKRLSVHISGLLILTHRVVDNPHVPLCLSRLQVVAAKRLMPHAPYGQVAPALRVLGDHHPDLGKAELPVLGVL